MKSNSRIPSRFTRNLPQRAWRLTQIFADFPYLLNASFIHHPIMHCSTVFRVPFDCNAWGPKLPLVGVWLCYYTFELWICNSDDVREEKHEVLTFVDNIIWQPNILNRPFGVAILFLKAANPCEPLKGPKQFIPSDPSWSGVWTCLHKTQP